jgi:hypothetical protein
MTDSITTIRLLCSGPVSGECGLCVRRAARVCGTLCGGQQPAAGQPLYGGSAGGRGPQAGGQLRHHDCSLLRGLHFKCFGIYLRSVPDPKKFYTDPDPGIKKF